MYHNAIGDILRKKRIQNGVSQKELALGLCSTATLSRLEEGERVADRFVLEALMQRMGMSPDKLTDILYQGDYEILNLRDEIDQNMSNYDFARARELLLQYQKQTRNKGAVMAQFAKKIQGLLLIEEFGKREEGMQLLLEALLTTCPNYQREKIQSTRFSVRELNILMLGVRYLEDEKIKYQMIQDIMIEMDRYYEDKQEKAKVFPKACYLLAGLHLQRGNYEEVLYECKHVLTDLQTSGKFEGFIPILGRIHEAYIKMGRTGEAAKIKRQLDSMKILFLTEFPDNLHKDFMIAPISGKQTVYLMHYMIRRSRMQNGISQEKLSEGICATETLARIENGKQNCRFQVFEKLCEKLGIQLDKFEVTVSTKDYQVLDMQKNVQLYCALQDYDRAFSELFEMKKRLDLDLDKNRQFVLSREAFLLWKTDQASADETLRRLGEALYFTIPDGKQTQVLSREEVQISICIADCFAKKREYWKTEKILNKLKDYYQEGAVDVRYNSVDLMGIILQYAKLYRARREYDKAVKVCKDGLKIGLQSGCGLLIPQLLLEQSFCLEQTTRNGREKYVACPLYLQRISDICELLGDKACKSQVDIARI